MPFQCKSLLPFVLLITGATSVWSKETGSPSVNVEAMIGEATLVQETADGEKDTIIVPSGQTTTRDPATGKTTLTPSTVPNRVNEVVQAIAAAAADAGDRLPTDEGCSQSKQPRRLVPRPEYDEEVEAAIAKQLEMMTPGELMMVMAVLINNANHLCIDSSAITSTIALITKVRPEEAANVVAVASLLDPAHARDYEGAGTPSRPPSPLNPKPPITPQPDIPPGGSIGEPPSPE